MSTSNSISNATSSATPTADHPFVQLPRTPLVPERILRRYGAYCSFDNRFRAAARLLQCLWLRDHDIPTAFSQAKEIASDELTAPSGYGSILSAEAANAGRNFLSPAIHRYAAQSWLLCEEDACIDEERLFGNALSSAPLTTNIFSVLAEDLDLASAVLQRLLPAYVQTVRRIELETSPGRRDPRYLNDRTAWDCAIHSVDPSGKPCIIYTEIKYSESLDHGNIARMRDRYSEASREVRLYDNPDSLILRSQPIEQLWREHMLAQLAVDHGVTPKAVFLALGPELNRRVQGAFKVYQGELIDTDRQEPGRVPFVPSSLEKLVHSIHLAGATELARSLWDRYLDFQRIYHLVLHEVAPHIGSASSPAALSSAVSRSASRVPSKVGRVASPRRRLTVPTGRRTIPLTAATNTATEPASSIASRPRRSSSRTKTSSAIQSTGSASAPSFSDEVPTVSSAEGGTP